MLHVDAEAIREEKRRRTVTAVAVKRMQRSAIGAYTTLRADTLKLSTAEFAFLAPGGDGDLTKEGLCVRDELQAQAVADNAALAKGHNNLKRDLTFGERPVAARPLRSHVAANLSSLMAPTRARATGPAARADWAHNRRSLRACAPACLPTHMPPCLPASPARPRMPLGPADEQEEE